LSLKNIYYCKIQDLDALQQINGVNYNQMSKPFTDLNLDERILKSISELGFTHCTEVQEKSFENTFLGRDIIVRSQTGTGKTAAFLISILNNFQNDSLPYNKLAVILAPTRELAIQIEKEAKEIAKYFSYRIVSVYGGVGYVQQEEDIAKGVDILVATPGRLIDYLNSQKISIANAGYVVIDEADRLFDMGFSKDVDYIISNTPPTGQRQTMLYSATITDKVKELAWKHIHNPVELDLSPENLIVSNVQHEIIHLSRSEKFRVLLGILKNIAPPTAMIFTNTKAGTLEVHKRLTENGITCDYITGDLPQKKRIKIITDLKEGKTKYLIATDVAARGIHVEDLEMVINYDLPEDPENYVHRIGRTARAGNKGRALTLVCERFVYNLEKLEAYLGFKLEVFWPDAGWYKTSDSSHRRPAESSSRGDRYKKSTHPERSDRRRKDSRTEKSREGAAPSGETRSPKHRKSPAVSAVTSAPQVEVSRQKQQPVITTKQVRKRRSGKSRPSKSQKIENRIKYYQEKYGETFVAEPHQSKGGLFSKITGAITSIFKKRK